MTKETRTRGTLKRTKKNHAIHPTIGRQQAIARLEKHLEKHEFLRELDRHPDMLVSITQLKRLGFLR